MLASVVCCVSSQKALCLVQALVGSISVFPPVFIAVRLPVFYWCAAQGIIMMVNAAAVNMFCYQKGELEGKNVNVLM